MKYLNIKKCLNLRDSIIEGGDFIVKNLDKYMNILEKICKVDKPGKKTVQKLMYLIEQKGVELGLNYRIHYYGPYSPDLDNILYILQNFDFIQMDTSRQTHTISITDKPFRSNGVFTPEEERNIDYVIDNFAHKSAFDLEGITTIHFVACTLKEKAGNIEDEKIIDEVMRIKGTKFTREQLEQYLNMLKEYEYIKQ